MSGISFLFLWAPVVLWAAVIFYLSSIPGLGTELGVWDIMLRKGAHVIEYAVLTALLSRAMGETWEKWAPNKILVWSGSVALLYAVSDEIHQRFVPNRGPSIWDVAIDAVGIVGVLYFLHKTNKNV